MSTRNTITDPLPGSIRPVRERSVLHALPHVVVIVSQLARDPSLHAVQTVARYLREHPRLGGSDRSVIRDLTFTYVRWRRRLRQALDVVRPDAGPEQAVASVCAALLLMHGHSIDTANAALANATSAGLNSDELHSLANAIGDLDPSLSESLSEFAVRTSYPDWAVTLLAESFDETHARAMLLASRGRAPVGLRVNTLKAEREDVISRLERDGYDPSAGTLSPWAIRLDENSDVRNHDLYRSGHVEIQDEGSQLIALACGAQPGMRIVDACAGAGGKSLALAAAMRDDGSILALDTDDRRLDELHRRADRAGVRCIRTAHTNDVGARRKYDGSSDIVLVDAPCSGSGTWRRIPDGPDHLTRDELTRLSEVQRGILTDVAHLVRTGGKLVYATCSMFREENDVTVSSWLAEHTDFRIRPLCGDTLPLDGPFLRLTPDMHDTDGFFVAVMERVR